MQLFSAEATMFSKRIKKKFWPAKSEKTGLKSYSLSAQTLLSHSPAQTTAHSQELIFHIMKSRDQTSVLLSVYQLKRLQNKKGSVRIANLNWEHSLKTAFLGPDGPFLFCNYFRTGDVTSSIKWGNLDG